MTDTRLTERTGLSEPTLYVVATPIGNLGDITLRALEVLKTVDAIAAEDTRVTRKLLAHYGISASLIALHQHNEEAAVRQVISSLHKGQSVALVADAGTPGISDPGMMAVARVRAEGYRVVPIPGPSAMLAAIAAAGFTALPFSFHGFLPGRKGERQKRLGELKSAAGLLVFYEAPHRILESVAAIAETFGGHRRIAIARELTKMFEQVHVCLLSEAPGWLQESEDHRRGEFVLLVEGLANAPVDAGDDPRRTVEILARELPLRQAVMLAAEITGGKKNALYDHALALKKNPTDA